MPVIAPKNHLNLLYLDGFRAAAAIYVVMYHALLQYYTLVEPNAPAIERASTKIFFFGHYAVDLFIVLSGFCLMLPVLNNNYTLKGGYLLFIKKRIIRILPPYFLAILLSIILSYTCISNKTGTHWDDSIPVTTNDILSHILLIHDFFRSQIAKINYSLWSVSVEFRIYLFFPLILLFWRKFGTWFVIIISVITIYLMHILLVCLQGYFPDIYVSFSGVSPYLVLFILGAIAAKFSFEVNSYIVSVKQIIYYVIPLLSFLLFLIVYVLSKKYQYNQYDFLFGGPVPAGVDLTVGLFCACLLFICAKTSNAEHKPNLLARAFSWGPLPFLGTFAYSIYLVHSPLLQVLSQYVINPLHLSRLNSYCLLLILCVVVIIPLAYLFFIFCEKPFIRLNKKISLKKLEMAAIINPAP